MNIEALIRSTTGISSIFSLLAFIALLAFLGYREYFKSKKSSLEKVSSEEAKIGIISDWLNIDTSKLNKNQIFSLAESKIKLKSKIINNIIIFIFIFFTTAVILLIFLTYNDSDNTDTACLDKIGEANTLVSRELYKQTIDVLEPAFSKCNQNQSAIATMIGHAQRNLERYREAIKWHEKALAIQTSQKANSEQLARLSANLAYSYEGIKNWEKSLEFHRKARNLASPESETYLDTYFSEGRIELIKYITNKEQIYLKNSEKSFLQYADLSTERNHIFEYNMSCILAYKNDYGNSLKLLEQSIVKLNKINSKSQKLHYHKDFLKSLILQPEINRFIPTFPTNCPKFSVVFNECECRDKISRMFL